KFGLLSRPSPLPGRGDPAGSACLLSVEFEDHAEAVTVRREVLQGRVARGGARLFWTVVPGAAAQDAKEDLLVLRPTRVPRRTRPVRRFVVPVLAVLLDVAVKVVEAPAVRLLLPHRVGAAVRVDRAPGVVVQLPAVVPERVGRGAAGPA